MSRQNLLLSAQMKEFLLHNKVIEIKSSVLYDRLTEISGRKVGEKQQWKKDVGESDLPGRIIGIAIKLGWKNARRDSSGKQGSQNVFMFGDRIDEKHNTPEKEMKPAISVSSLNSSQIPNVSQFSDEFKEFKNYMRLAAVKLENMEVVVGTSNKNIEILRVDTDVKIGRMEKDVIKLGKDISDNGQKQKDLSDSFDEYKRNEGIRFKNHINNFLTENFPSIVNIGQVGNKPRKVQSNDGSIVRVISLGN